MLLFLSLYKTESKNFCCDLSQSVRHMLSLWNFMDSSLTFRSLIHFKFIFVYDVRECSNFILLHMIGQFSSHFLLKRLLFLHYVFLYVIYMYSVCHTNCKCVGVSMSTLSCPIDLCLCFCASVILSCGEGSGTHSSTLAWKIPWTEEPGRLQSMGSRRV